MLYILLKSHFEVNMSRKVALLIWMKSSLINTAKIRDAALPWIDVDLSSRHFFQMSRDMTKPTKWVCV